MGIVYHVVAEYVTKNGRSHGRLQRFWKRATKREALKQARKVCQDYSEAGKRRRVIVFCTDPKDARTRREQMAMALACPEYLVFTRTVNLNGGTK